MVLIVVVVVVGPVDMWAGRSRSGELSTYPQAAPLAGRQQCR